MHQRLPLRDLSIAAVLFAANLIVIGPWFLTDFSDQPWNNGYIYIAIASLFKKHSWGWNPLQYAGAPFHYLYPPLFHVLIGALPVRSLGLAFHLVTGIGYALVPVALYVLCRQLFGSRLVSAFAAIAWGLFPSPAYALPQWRGIAQPYFHAPWGFVTLVAYDEAAHTFALPFMLLAIAAAWRERWLAATLLTAAVLLTNWPALIGLLMMLTALAIARHAWRAAAVTGTAYGLSAFWMTPAYFVSSSLLNRVVLRHTLTAAPFSRTTWEILAVAAALIALAFWRRIPAPLRLALAWVALTGVVIVALTLAGNYLLPSPHRYMLEFNAGLLVLIAALVSLAPPKLRQTLLALLLVTGSSAGLPFLMHAWKLQPSGQNPRTGAAYQVASWLNQHAGSSRVFVAGELDSTLPLWSNVPQVGGSGQDVSNFLIFAAERQVAYGCGADSERIAELWLRALNVEYLAAHGPASSEYFHWIVGPDKFAGLPVAWDDGAGDTVYRVPEFDPHQAVVVDLNAMSRLPRFGSTRDSDFLEAYVKWAAGKRPANIRWSPDLATLDERLAPDEAILVKINHDPGWHASNAVTAADPIGFLLIRNPRGAGPIKLRFGPSWDVWLARIITVFTILALIAMRGPRLWIALAAVIPAVAAYAILMARIPSTVAVAEDAFIHLQPPIINPGGIVDGATNRPPPFHRGSVIAVYGLNFGQPPNAAVRLNLDGRPAEMIYRGPNLITFRMPADAPAKPVVSVEVNGCRGNEFAVAIE